MSFKLKRALIDLLAGFLWLVAFLGLCLRARFALCLDWLSVILLSVAGLIINYYLSVFVHESGHLIFALKSGACPVKINFGLITLERDCRFENESFGFGKWRAKISPIFGDAGESAFVAVKKISPSKLKTIAFGGLIISLIYCGACFCTLLFVKNAVVFCLFGAGACSAFYLFCINVIPLDKTNDGSLILFNEYCRGVADMLEFSRLLCVNADVGEFKNLALKSKTEGKKPSAYGEYINYFASAASGAASVAAENLCESFKNANLNELCSDEFSLIFPELIFACCVLKNERFLRENSVLIENYFSNATENLPAEPNESDFKADLTNLSVLRAHAAYREFLNNHEWSNALKNTYFKLFALAEKGSGAAAVLSFEKNLTQLQNLSIE